MWKFIQVVQTVLLLRKGREGRKEIVNEFSFSFIETIFFASFFILALLVGGLFVLVYFTQNTVATVFAVLLSTILIFDIWVYLRVKRAVTELIEKGMQFGEQQVQRLREHFIDIEVEE